MYTVRIGTEFKKGITALLYEEFYIPERMMPGILAYVENGQLPGSFLQAVISNNLKESFAQADDENKKNIQAFVAYFYNEVPAPAWGSPEAMMNWSEQGGMKGIAEAVGSSREN